MSEKQLQEELNLIQSQQTKSQLLYLKRRNQQLEKQKALLRSMNQGLKRELRVYKEGITNGTCQSDVLEYQHNTILSLEEKLTTTTGKYQKLLSSNGFKSETTSLGRIKQLQKKIWEQQRESQIQIRDLKERLTRQGAQEILQTKKSLQPLSSPGKTFPYMRAG